MTTLDNNSALASLLEGRLVDWEKARSPQELKMLECYQDVMRIARDEDTKGTGAAKAKKASSLFIGSTRNKVRSARAKINDALFGNGVFPFDTEPTNESLAEYADAVEEILTEQFDRMGLKSLLKTGVNTLATYGTGFIFGPFVRKECLYETSADNSAGFTQLIEQKYEFDHPYFDLASTLDVYPDPEARDIESCLGVFWSTMESPHTIVAWKNDKAYKNIDQALIGPGDRGQEPGSDTAGKLRANVEFWHKNERIKVARYFGKVPANLLNESAQENSAEVSLDEAKEGDMVDAIVIMAGGVVVKVDESPYNGKSAAMRCLYEAIEHEMWGVGVAENNQPHQKVTNAAFRLFMEGKGMALLGTTSVDRSKFLPTEDFKKFPGKVYQMKPGLTPDERKSAIMHNVEPDVTGGWLDVIRVSEQFSDDDTGITKYTQGDDASHLNKTATGISMIMSASSLPIKEVIQNIDELWIEEIVERTIEWDLKFLEVETVQKIHGDKIAAIWQQIKQFGKTSFMEWKATGVSSFMQKEVLTNKIRAFSEFALGNPITAPHVDAKELLQQTWDVMEIGRESPIVEDDKEGGLPPQVQEHMQQMQGEMQQMHQALVETSKKLEELQSQDQIERYKAESDRLKIIIPYLGANELAQVAATVGVQVMDTPDIAPGIDANGAASPAYEQMETPEQVPEMPVEVQEYMPPPDPQNQTEQEPATAGFFTPEQDQMQ